jgi:hypothetical protein
MNNPKHLHLGNVYGDISQAQPHRTSKQQLHDELEEVISSSHDVLCSAKTVFPLTLFPDTITVDRAKVSVTQRNFFLTGEAITIRIEDILNVTATVGPFFGSIKVTTKYFNPDKPYVIDKLWRKDALRIKRILQGYVIARQRDVDVSQMSSRELAKQLDEIGSVADQDKL